MKTEQELKNILSSFVKIAIILLVVCDVLGCGGSGGHGGIEEKRFTDLGNGTVRDNETRLIWLKDASALGTGSWDTARTVVASLDAGDFDWLKDGSAEGGWRLPTKAEWEAFLDQSYSDPALCDAAGSAQWAQGDAFTNVQSDWYWSKDEHSTNADFAYGINVGSYTVEYGPKSEDDLYIWPVHSDRFTDMGDGTVRDNETRLIWMKNANAFGTATWDNALAIAQTIDEDDFDWLNDGSSEGDWRLPDLDEWEALSDTRYSDPALCNTTGTSQWSEGDAFIHVQSDYYWSRALQIMYPLPIAINVENGEGAGLEDSNEFYVWPVRRSYDRFTDMENGTVRDNDSGLIWLKNANAYGSMDLVAARNAVAALSTGELGLSDGSSDGDWRLPSIEEWEAFMVRYYNSPSLCNSTDTGQHVNGDPFLNIMDNKYWTDSIIDCGCTIPYCGDFADMTDGYVSTSSGYCGNNDFYVWPVRYPD